MGHATRASKLRPTFSRDYPLRERKRRRGERDVVYNTTYYCLRGTMYKYVVVSNSSSSSILLVVPSTYILVGNIAVQVLLQRWAYLVHVPMYTVHNSLYGCTTMERQYHVHVHSTMYICTCTRYYVHSAKKDWYSYEVRTRYIVYVLCTQVRTMYST